MEDVILPHSVRKIGVSAFESCTNLESAAIKGELAMVRESSLCGCKNLSAIDLNRIGKAEKGVFKKTCLE